MPFIFSHATLRFSFLFLSFAEKAVENDPIRVFSSATSFSALIGVIGSKSPFERQSIILSEVLSISIINLLSEFAISSLTFRNSFF